MTIATPVLLKPIELQLPVGALVHIRVYTNAAYKQRVTIQLIKGSTPPIIFEGNGEKDHLIGEQFWTVPGPNPVTTTVMIEHANNGPYQPSKMQKIGCTLQTFNMLGVLSEDIGDVGDFNDAVVEFTWWK